jgi:hypothetical protein
MLDSRPSRTGRSSKLPEQRWRSPRGRRRGDWFGFSTVLHLIAIAALVYFTPLRTLLEPAEITHAEPEMTMSSKELDRLSEAIEQRTLDDVRYHAAELDSVLTQIVVLHEQIDQRFRLYDAHRRARAAQDAARHMRRAVTSMLAAVEAIASNSVDTRIEKLQALAEQAQAHARAKLELLTGGVERVIMLHTDAERTLRAAKYAHDAQRESSRRVDTLQSQFDAVTNEVAQREEQLRQSNDAQRAREQERLDTVLARVIDVTSNLVLQTTQEVAFARTALALQQQAVTSQQVAVATLQAAFTPSASTPTVVAPVTHGFTVPESLYATNDLVTLDLPELYDRSRSTEDAAAAVFKEIRAADLAMVRDMTLVDARDDIDLVRPVRPDIDAPLLRAPVRTGARFDAHKEELKKAVRETGSMVNLGHRMLQMARQSVADLRFGVDIDYMPEMEQEAEFQLVIRELAMEDISGRFADLSGVMQGEPITATEGPVQLEDVAGAESFMPGMEGDGEGVPQLTRDVKAFGARAIAADGHPSAWMYVDSWYTIGPFPNPGRVNIDREFPPDSMIDLDATYIGKNGRRVHWQFTQSTDPELVPPTAEEYGIWYAYTEIHSDAERDILVALGTDDRGTLKINGVPVWISSKRLKGWDIDEVWRKIHLRAGLNRVLYRVENGWLHVGFSMVMRTAE